MDINHRTRTILQMCNTGNHDNESGSVRDNEIIENPEPFENSVDEYVPTDNDSDSDEDQEEQFENNVPITEEGNSVQLVGHAEAQLNKSRRGREKENAAGASRKRKRNPSEWTRNIRKSLKTQGREYTLVALLAPSHRYFS
ncbi:hypothetical protein QE152_g23227 [Popillia japonica]|uniref:Uncharacterized protein n=1 Tax=Popillia japonica TaxID=7064 RepID=A0AAW1KIH8_POPJA